MPRYLNPKNDVPFKKIFGEHAHLLISLLNALLPLKEGQQIVDITYLLPQQMPETILGKRSEVDVKCRDTQGRTFIVEMQMHWSPDFAQRMVFNASRVLVKQLDKVKLEDVAKAFKNMQPVYSLALVVDRFKPKDGKRWYYHYKVADIKTPARTIEGMEFIVVDFENFKLNRAGLLGWTPDKRHMAVLWLRFFAEMYEGATPAPDLLEQKEVEEALKICEDGRLLLRRNASLRGLLGLRSLGADADG